MMFQYLMPTKIHFGRGVIENNKNDMEKLGRKAYIITGKSSSKVNGSLAQITNALERLAIKYAIFDEVEENPSIETVEKAAAIGQKENVDFVIGIGGGSPLDVAKAVAVFIKNPQINKDNIIGSQQLSYLPVVAVPTTSGTGSEVTQHSVITFHREKTKKNLGQAIFPRVAYLDSSFTDHTPYDITVNTAIDAFTHLVESYLNTNATMMSDLYCEKGLELFKSCFEHLINRNLTEKFRDSMMLASMFGGIAIAQTGTSLPHGMGYPLTYYKGLPHGLANGVLTIEYLKIFKNKDKIKRMLKLLGMDKMEQLEKVFDTLIQVDIKLTSEEILEYSSGIASNKRKLKNHPEEVGEKDIEKVYRNSFK
ncbi:MAG: iron-containing alcohol dehydrogenase [Clostridiales bacterium]|nr:iron-containing alcohol dehydrogenase [Clostridiales bacterium]